MFRRALTSAWTGPTASSGFASRGRTGRNGLCWAIGLCVGAAGYARASEVRVARSKRRMQRCTATEALTRRLNEVGAEVLPMPAGERKISEVFLEFADPVLDLLRSSPRGARRREFEQALTLAQLAWNTALLPDAEAACREFFDELADDPESVAIMRGLVETLLLRRRSSEFSGDRRVVRYFEVAQGAPGQIRLAVACTLGGADDESRGAT